MVTALRNHVPLNCDLRSEVILQDRYQMHCNKVRCSNYLAAEAGNKIRRKLLQNFFLYPPIEIAFSFLPQSKNHRHIQGMPQPIYFSSSTGPQHPIVLQTLFPFAKAFYLFYTAAASTSDNIYDSPPVVHRRPDRLTILLHCAVWKVQKLCIVHRYLLNL